MAHFLPSGCELNVLDECRGTNMGVGTIKSGLQIYRADTGAAQAMKTVPKPEISPCVGFMERQMRESGFTSIMNLLMYRELTQKM